MPAKTARVVARPNAVWIWGAALAALTACDTPLCSCTPPSLHATIIGVVSTNAGAPAIGVVVTTTVRDATCSTPELGANTSPVGATPDAAGRYRIEVFSPVRDQLCVRILARRSVPNDSAVRDSVQLHLAERGDSIRVDLTLP